MRKLGLRIFLLVLPIIVLLLCMEWYCRTQTPFSIKKQYLETHLNSIEILILGSSHNQNAINPAFLSKNSCNLAFGGQPISIDYYLLDKYIDKMPKLNTVIFEITTYKFYDELNSSDWNGHIYSNFYNIKYKAEPFSLKNYSIVYSDYTFFSSIFFDFIKPFGYKIQKNKFGFITNDFHDRFEKLNYDSMEIKKTFIMQHKFTGKENLAPNKTFLDNSIKKCVSKGIKVVFVTPPLYSTYYNGIPGDAKKEVNNLVSNFAAAYGISYYDFSCDKRFHLHDFKNDNHLNSKGAEKFSEILNYELLENKNSSAFKDIIRK